MVKIRLSRRGKKNDPFYRIVAIDSARSREGKSLEVLGYWHPREEKLEIDKAGVERWRKKGAQISRAVEKLLK